MYQKESAREFQRRRAVELVEKGEPRNLIARILGVSMVSISRWHKIHLAGGSLKFLKSSGRPRRLSINQLETLRELLSKGATAHGWHNDLWTSKRVAEVIRTNFGIKFANNHVWTILTKYLGWTVQRPIQQLRERNDLEIEYWKSQALLEIIRDTEKRGAYLIFIDESGFMLSPQIRRTFAPRGKTPIVKVGDPHSRISTIGALTISPNRKHLGFSYHLLPDNANFRSRSVIQFIGKIFHRIPGQITVLWDAIPIHCSQPVVQYFERYHRLRAETFPSYAPELNPVDKVWHYLKYDRLPNYTPTTLIELRNRLTKELEDLQNNQEVLASCIRRSGIGHSLGY